MRDAVCWNARRGIAGLDDENPATKRHLAHGATCLRCQAEVAKFRRLRRELAGLAARHEPAPSRLVAAVLVELEAENRPVSSRLSGVAAAGAAAVVAAGTMVVLRRLRSVA